VPARVKSTTTDLRLRFLDEMERGRQQGHSYYLEVLPWRDRQKNMPAAELKKYTETFWTAWTNEQSSIVSTKEVDMRCKLCSAQSDLAFTKDDYNIYKCRSCSFLFVHPMPDASRSHSSTRTATQKWVRRLETIEKHRAEDDGKTILDVGCATGDFLEAAAQKGWNIYGIEHSPFAADQAKQKFGNAKIVCSDFLSYKSSAKFTALSAWAVLEHVGEPQAFLQKANALLENHGIFALSTVNVNSLNRWIFGKRWRYFMPPEHLVYFNLDNLRWALRKAGFDLLELETNFSYQSALDGLQRGNRGLAEPNLPIKLLLSAPKVMSQWLHWGDIVEVWARKSA
jgi:2-polyprenyl-3-methyl-5-hydroxy-6-metoxy-1,4-benzoquinol methylase